MRAAHSIRLFALTVALAAASLAQAQSFKFQQPLENDPDVVLQEIVRDAQQTRVSILIQNTTEYVAEACGHATGAPEAFVLKDLDSGVVLKQQSITGLSDCAVKMDEIQPGASTLLHITFAALPAKTKRLQLSEGACKPNKPDAELEHWCFKKIVLPAR